MVSIKTGVRAMHQKWSYFGFVLFLLAEATTDKTTKFERLVKGKHRTIGKNYLFENNFYSKITRIRERISFKLKLTKGSNVGGTESESGFWPLYTVRSRGRWRNWRWLRPCSWWWKSWGESRSGNCSQTALVARGEILKRRFKIKQEWSFLVPVNPI